jgi:uncharacterized membrane protein YeaQ/YmgE (transglycosylase-associated protein family)
MIWTLIIGLVIGVVAKFFMPGQDPGGFIITILLGISGSMLASWLGGALGIYTVGEAASFVAAVLGAMLILFIYRLFSGQNKTA